MRPLMTRKLVWLLIGIFSFLIVVSLSLTPIVSQAQSSSQCQANAIAQGESGTSLRPCPEAAFVSRVFDEGRKRGIERVTYRPGQEDEIGGSYGQVVYDTNTIRARGGDRNSGVLLRFTTVREWSGAVRGLIQGYLAAAGFSADVNNTAVYTYPCQAYGPYAIGWESESARNAEPACRQVAFNRTLRGYDYLDPVNATPIPQGVNSLSKIWNPVLKQNPNEIFANSGDVAPIHLRQFCSVVAPGTLNWQVKLASRAASEVGDVCEQALVECQEDAGTECLIIRQGFWRSISPNPDLRQIRLQFRCSNTSNFVPYDEIVGSNDIYDEWDKLEKTARDSEAKGCVLSIYNRDDILVAPDPDQRTLVHFDDDRDELVVTTLVGTSTVTQPGNINALTPISVEAGHQFVLSYDDYSGIDTTLEDSEKEDIYYLPIIQAFQNPDLWEQLYSDDPIKEQIQNFRDAIASQFWQPLPIRIIDGSGQITSSNVREIRVGMGSDLSVAAGSYDPSTNKINLEIRRNQAEMRLNLPLEDDKPITFSITRLSPGGSGSLLENSITILNRPDTDWGGGTLQKQGDRISGDFTIRSPFRRGNVDDEDGLVTGVFSLTVED